MKRSELLFTAAKPPLDYLAIVFAAVAAYFIRYLPSIQKFRPVVFDLSFKDYFPLTLTTAAIWVVIFALSGLYSTAGIKKAREEFGRIFVACSAGLAIVLAVMVFSRFLFDSRFIILVGWGFAIIFVSIERLLITIAQRIAYKFGFGVNRIAIIGNGNVARELDQAFSRQPGLGYRVVAKFDDFAHEIKEKLKLMAINDQVDEIIQVNPNLNREQTIDLIDFINEYHLDFKYTADLIGTQLTNLEVATFAGMPIVEVKKTRLDGWGKIYKRIFDLVFSLILIIIFSPILILIAIAIKIDSPGPILFKYKRTGQFGKPFKYFKFRSMIKGAHQYRFNSEFVSKQENLREGTPMMKFKNDPRITRVGKILRKFSLDELPELFIVLTGKMSLVGPRPHEIEEVEKYKKHHKKVLNIKPGITGLAQVSGRSDLDFEEEVKLDTFYIENWSLGLDIQIIFKTPGAVFKKRKTE